MSQIALTDEERLQAIQRFGYTEREAAFLRVAALHSGNFTLSQYCRFSGRAMGGTAATLAQKALAKGHAKISTYCNNAKVYHLCSRPFYAAIGQADNRNRREHQPFTIKNRLLGLDFVLSHPNHRFLATEQDKVNYFRSLGIEPSALPTKVYRDGMRSGATKRYFVDKYPIFLRAQPGSLASTVAAFCFVDEGIVTLSRFETYLKQYRLLFEALPGFELVYVAETNVLFPWAERLFWRFAASRDSAGKPAVDPAIARMLEHFEARSLYDSGCLESFDRAKLVRLRDEREEYSGAEFSALYERWKLHGEHGVLEVLAPECAVDKRSATTFSTYLIKEHYDLFGSLRAS